MSNTRSSRSGRSSTVPNSPSGSGTEEPVMSPAATLAALRKRNKEKAEEHLKGMDAKGKRVCKLINGIFFQSNLFQDDSSPPATLTETDNGFIYDPKCVTQLNRHGLAMVLQAPKSGDQTTVSVETLEETRADNTQVWSPLLLEEPSASQQSDLALMQEYLFRLSGYLVDDLQSALLSVFAKEILKDAKQLETIMDEMYAGRFLHYLAKPSVIGTRTITAADRVCRVVLRTTPVTQPVSATTTHNVSVLAEKRPELDKGTKKANFSPDELNSFRKKAQTFINQGTEKLLWSEVFQGDNHWPDRLRTRYNTYNSGKSGKTLHDDDDLNDLTLDEFITLLKSFNEDQCSDKSSLLTAMEKLPQWHKSSKLQAGLFLEAHLTTNMTLLNNLLQANDLIAKEVRDKEFIKWALSRLDNAGKQVQSESGSNFYYLKGQMEEFQAAQEADTSGSTCEWGKWKAHLATTVVQFEKSYKSHMNALQHHPEHSSKESLPNKNTGKRSMDNNNPRPNKALKTEQPVGLSRCQGCGGYHSGINKECPKKYHPEFNHSHATVRFKDSPGGKAWAKKYPRIKEVAISAYCKADDTPVTVPVELQARFPGKTEQPHRGNYKGMSIRFPPEPTVCQPCQPNTRRLTAPTGSRGQCPVCEYELLLIRQGEQDTTDPPVKRKKTSMSLPQASFADTPHELRPSYAESAGKIPVRIRTLAAYTDKQGILKSPDNVYISPLVSTPELTVTAILDSQAGGNNSYVGEPTARWMEANGATRRKSSTACINSWNTHERGAISDEELDVVVGVYDNRNKRVVDLILTCRILPTQHALIISREHIQSFELLHHINAESVQRKWEISNRNDTVRDQPTERSQHILQVLSLECERLEAEAFHDSFEKEGDDIAAMISHMEKEATEAVRGPQASYSNQQAFLAAQATVVERHSNVFRETLAETPAKCEPMQLKVDESIWNQPKNRTPHRQYSREKILEIERQVKLMLEAGIIERSQAQSHSHVLLTPKPNGAWRFCLDYRRLNEASEAMGYPIPNIKELIQRLGVAKAKVFGTMDLTQGFYQCKLAEESRKYTAFVTSSGKYQWKRVAMGLRSAPSYFQSQMSTILGDYLWNKCEVYMDDVIVYGSTQAEYLNNLDAVLARLAENGLTVNPKKCKFGLDEVEFVGHTISYDKHTINKDKISKALQFDKPVFHKQMKSFLGLANYFRDHIKNHSIVTAPLQRMIHNYTKGQCLKWDEETTKAFDDIKHAICHLPALYFLTDDELKDADGNIVPTSIHLYCDASDVGMGGYIIQRVGEGTAAEERPIAFMSRSFTKTERRYNVTEREAYAIHASVKKFEHLLLGRKFTIHTDHKSLIYINDTGSPKVIRWKLALQQFDYDVQHIKGELNVVADYLSRHVFAHEKNDDIDLLLLYEQEIPKDKFKLIQQVHNSTAGHHGVERTLSRLRAAGHNWPSMRTHVKSFLHTCPACQKMSFLRTPIETTPFTTSTYYCQARLSTDLIGPFPPDDVGNTYLMLVIDNFSRFVDLYPIKDSTAESACKGLLSHFGRYGCPSEIVSDNGSHFTADMTRELLELMQVDHITIAAYSHPQNSIAERAIKEINKHIRNLIYEDRRTREEWTVAAPMAQRIYNSAYSESIGCSPAHIMFGNAVHIERGFLPAPEANLNNHGMPLSKRIAEIIRTQHLVIERAQKIIQQRDAQYQKANADRKPTTFEIGSYVLIVPETTAFGKGRANRLDAINKGPMEVIARSQHKDSYTVRNLVNNNVKDVITKRLKPYRISANTEATVQDAALPDHDAYIVEKVLAHKGCFKKNASKVTLRIKWEGYDTCDNTWEPWSGKLYGLKNNSVVHDYLRANNLTKYIPAKFK